MVVLHQKRWNHHLNRPVFNTVADAVANEGANTSVILPPAFAGDAIMSCFAGIKLIAITEGIPRI